MFRSAIVPLALAASALANVFITSPTSSSTLAAGQPVNCSWIDDGKTPSLAQFGMGTFGIYAGNSIEQTLLQTINPSVNVSAMSSFSFTPSASIGPDSNVYFIRATSQSFMNPSSPQYPQEAFSAKFTLTGMTGTFNASVQAEISGQSTTSVAGMTSASGVTAATGMTTSTTAKLASSASSAMASTTAMPTNGAGKPVIATAFVTFVAALVGVSLL